MKECIIVGAGDFDADCWEQCRDAYVIAADAGYLHLKKLGVIPDYWIGDMDSIREMGEEPCNEQCKMKILPIEKDDTDMLAAIRCGLEKQCEIFHMYGCLGGRLDHTLANIQCLLFLNNKGAKGYLHGKDCCVELVCNGSRKYPASMQGRISVFAFGGMAYGVTERGLYYSLDKAVLRPDYPVGISNEFIGQESIVEVEKGMLLLYTQK